MILDIEKRYADSEMLNGRNVSNLFTVFGAEA